MPQKKRLIVTRGCAARSQTMQLAVKISDETFRRIFLPNCVLSSSTTPVQASSAAVWRAQGRGNTSVRLNLRAHGGIVKIFDTGLRPRVNRALSSIVLTARDA